MTAYLVPGRNYDTVAWADTVPPGRRPLTTAAELEAAVREQLAWEVGSGYLPADTDVEAEVTAALALLEG